MNLFAIAREKVVASLEGLVPPELDFSKVSVDQPRDLKHGDLATNAAMVVAKPAGLKPRDLAIQLAKRLQSWDWLEVVEIAGPGFINMRVKNIAWHELLRSISASGEKFGHSSIGNGNKINVEYVSANPTGPLHMGHVRGAVIGDVLANVLESVGFEVTREYYVNDSGNQVNVLAHTVHLRYRELFGENIQIPEGAYGGMYVVEVADALKRRDGDKWLANNNWHDTIRDFAINFLLDDIKLDLKKLGITQIFSSEAELIEAGKVEACLTDLNEKGLLYNGVLEPPKGKKPDDWEPREQLLFKATNFGDEVDRPLKKSDGTNTYFCNDIAYHRDKALRTQGKLINIWGEDHKGHVLRTAAATRAVTNGSLDLEVLICALVKVLDQGRPVRMSKRMGTFTTLRDVLDKVGPDVLRFSMLTRKPSETMDFDVSAAVEQSKDNPVFYVQYAHARTRSLRHQVGKVWTDDQKIVNSQQLTDLSSLTVEDLEVVKQLALWPKILEAAALQREPHRLAFYLHDLAAAFNARWSMGREPGLRFILEDNFNLTAARLFLVEQVAVTLRAGLQLMGVVPLEELRDDTVRDNIGGGSRSGF